MKIEVFKHGEGYGYRVDNIYQEYDPDCEGFVPMDKERVEECVLAVVKRLSESEVSDTTLK